MRQDVCAPFLTRNNIVLAVVLYGLLSLIFFNECLGDFWIRRLGFPHMFTVFKCRATFSWKNAQSFLIEINFSCAAIENFMHHLYSGSSFEICEKFQSWVTPKWTVALSASSLIYGLWIWTLLEITERKLQLFVLFFWNYSSRAQDFLGPAQGRKVQHHL